MRVAQRLFCTRRGKDGCFVKKLVSVAVALLSCCLFAVTAFADVTVDMSHIYNFEDATIQAGDVFIWYYDGQACSGGSGYLDFYVTGDINAQGDVSNVNNDLGGMTMRLETVAPGTLYITLDGPDGTLKTITLTVEGSETAAGQAGENTNSSAPEESETPAGESETPAEEPAAPVAPVAPITVAPIAPVYAHSEIADAIADGTWGAEYTTCPACGYHNWTATADGYVCDTCGYITASVKTGSGVRGYVSPLAGVKATAATAPAAPATEADVAAAQAANDAYLAAIADLQAQVAQREAAYLAALNG